MAGGAIIQAPIHPPVPAMTLRRLFTTTTLLLPLLATAQSSSGPTPPTDAGATITTSSGLVFKLQKAGTGPSPAATDTVKVHYRGTFADGANKGKEFDSSYSRGRPAELPLEALVPCWQEVLQQMKPGGAVRIVCPPATAYGSRGVPGRIPPDSTLNFVIELLEVKR